MRYSNRFFLYAPIVLLLALAAAAMIWWKIAATSLVKRLTESNGREIMPGVRMSYASSSLGGAPFNLDTVLEDFALQIQTRTGPLTWKSEHFAIHALTYGHDQQIYEAAGRQTFAWTDSEGAHHQFTFVPGSLRASAVTADGQLSRFDLDVAALNSPDISAQRLQFHIRRAPQKDALEFVASGESVRLASNLRTGWSEVISDVNFDGTISPVLPLQTLLSGQSDWRTTADAWRRREGIVFMRHVSLDWGKMSGNGSAELWLDDQHRPAGNVGLWLSHADSFGGDDAKSDLFSQRVESAIRTLLSSTGRSDTAPLYAVFILHDGNLYLEPHQKKKIGFITYPLGEKPDRGSPRISFDHLFGELITGYGSLQTIEPLY